MGRLVSYSEFEEGALKVLVGLGLRSGDDRSLAEDRKILKTLYNERSRPDGLMEVSKMNDLIWGYVSGVGNQMNIGVISPVDERRFRN